MNAIGDPREHRLLSLSRWFGCRTTARRRRGVNGLPWAAALAAAGALWLGVPAPAQAARTAGAAGPVRFAVIGDPHFYDTRLGTSGSAFEAYLAGDPKLLRESEAILDAALEGVAAEGVRFALIVGDMTKDGELSSHVRLAQRLHELEKRGIEVYVVPGNHDIRNPDAVGYNGDLTYPVPAVSAQTFRALYQRFGYNRALAHAPDSLSYVAEPAPGLWLLALDSSKYDENQEGEAPVVGGALSAETLGWALGKIQEGRLGGKTVIGLMHHGVNPDFLPQPLLFPDYLVDDWPMVSTQLAAAGLEVVFTGHYHSQDASFAPPGLPLRTLCDVETSSLASYPNAYRVATLDQQGQLEIESRWVTEIDFDTGGVPFPDYAEAFLAARLPALATARLVSQFGVPETLATLLAPIVADALMAQYAGDESPDPMTAAMLDGLVGSPEPLHSLGLLLWGIWTDLPPADHAVSLTLE